MVRFPSGKLFCFCGYCHQPSHDALVNYVLLLLQDNTPVHKMYVASSYL